MILMDFFRIWPLLDIVAMTPISLKMYNTVTNCDTGYVEIRCNVDRDSFKVIHSIMLIKHDEIVARVSYDGKSKEDTKNTQSTNRSGVSVESLISNISVLSLSIKIKGSEVEPTKDEGPYTCSVEGLDAKQGLKTEHTSLKMLNITESNLECSQSTMEIHLTNSVPTVESPSSKNTNTVKHNENKINIGTYRELIVVTGVLICCILLLIMVREIRIYYCTSEDIVYV